MYSKFFDNMGPLPHHIHHNDEKAALIRTNWVNPKLIISLLN